MKDLLKLFVCLALLSTQAFHSEDACARSPEPPGAVGIDDYHEKLVEQLTNRIKKFDERCVVEGVDPSKLPTAVPSDLPEPLRDLVRDRAICVDKLNEIDAVYNSNLPNDVKLKALQEKANFLVAEGYIDKTPPAVGPETSGVEPGTEEKKSAGGAVGALGRLDEVFKKLRSSSPGKTPKDEGEAGGVEKEQRAAGTNTPSASEAAKTVTREAQAGPQEGAAGIQEQVGVEELKPPPKSAGVVVSTSGVAEVQLPDSEEFIPLEKGMDIPEGSTIFTGSGTFLLIRGANGRTVEIPPLEEVKIGPDTFSPDSKYGGRLEIRPGRQKVEPKESTHRSDPTDIKGPEPSASPQG